MGIKDYMNNGNLKFNGLLKSREATKGIVLHHAAKQYMTPRQIHEVHLKRGWMGAGYNVYIRKDGSVWELRPLWAIGAHSASKVKGVGGSNNSETIGVCAEGMYHTSSNISYDTVMPDVQLQMVLKVVQDLKKEYDSIEWIKGHREMPGASTVCPGKYFPLEHIKKAVSGNYEGKEDDAMKKGDRGAEVEKVQKLLIKLNYSLPRYGADGIFGTETETAVNALKKAMNLPQNGIIDIHTIIAIADIIEKNREVLAKENIQFIEYFKLHNRHPSHLPAVV
jgi:N-acetylmuramoyl-L-alanine amidase